MNNVPKMIMREDGPAVRCEWEELKERLNSLEELAESLNRTAKSGLSMIKGDDTATKEQKLEAEQPAGLNDLQRLVHQGRRVGPDLEAKNPNGFFPFMHERIQEISRKLSEAHDALDRILA